MVFNYASGFLAAEHKIDNKKEGTYTKTRLLIFFRKILAKKNTRQKNKKKSRYVHIDGLLTFTLASSLKDKHKIDSRNLS